MANRDLHNLPKYYVFCCILPKNVLYYKVIYGGFADDTYVDTANGWDLSGDRCLRIRDDQLLDIV